MWVPLKLRVWHECAVQLEEKCFWALQYQLSEKY
jgi:hypothetical protein